MSLSKVKTRDYPPVAAKNVYINRFGNVNWQYLILLNPTQAQNVSLTVMAIDSEGSLIYNNSIINTNLTVPANELACKNLIINAINTIYPGNSIGVSDFTYNGATALSINFRASYLTTDLYPIQTTITVHYGTTVFSIASNFY